MQDLRSLILLALAALVNAQSAPGFPVQVDTNLRVDFQSSSTSVSPAGVLLSRDDVSEEPTIAGPQDSSRTVDYMVFMIDQDVTTSSDSSTRVQFLHWYQPNLSGASEVLFDGGSDTTNFTSAPTMEFIQPSPPAGDIAHKYTVVMYNQPKGFSIPSAFTSVFQDKSDNSNRLNFDIAGFVSAAGLGQPVAANWFEVQNTAAAASTTSAPPTSKSTTTAEAATSTSTTTPSPSTSFFTSTTSTTEDATTTDFTSTEAITSTSESTSTAEAPGITLPPADASTSTFVITASQTPEATAPPPSASASAVISPDSGSGAGLVDAHSSARVLILSLMLSVAGAGLWLL